MKAFSVIKKLLLRNSLAFCTYAIIFFALAFYYHHYSRSIDAGEKEVSMVVYILLFSAVHAMLMIILGLYNFFSSHRPAVLMYYCIMSFLILVAGLCLAWLIVPFF